MEIFSWNIFLKIFFWQYRRNWWSREFNHLLYVGMLSLSGNGIVLWIFGLTRSLRSGTNLLIVNLALSDILMMTTNFPLLITNCFNHKWSWGPIMCEVSYLTLWNIFGSYWANKTSLVIFFYKKGQRFQLSFWPKWQQNSIWVKKVSKI